MYILDQEGKNLFNIEQFTSITNETLEWLKIPYIIKASIITVEDKKSFSLGAYKTETNANHVFKSIIRSIKAGDEIFVMPDDWEE